jgi:hypothetical protein
MLYWLIVESTDLQWSTSGSSSSSSVLATGCTAPAVINLAGTCIRRIIHLAFRDGPRETFCYQRLLDSTAHRTSGGAPFRLACSRSLLLHSL